MPEQHIEDLFEDRARKGDGSFAIAFALMQTAREQKSIAYQLGRLGMGDAASSMGAIELLSKTVDDLGKTVGYAIEEFRSG